MSWEPPFSTGTDRADSTGLRRLLGANPKRLLMPALAVGLAAVMLAPDGDEVPRRVPSPVAAVGSTTPSPLPTSDSKPLGVPAESSAGTSATPPASTVEAPVVQDAGQTIYSIYLYKLPGLAPDAAPGSVVDIWVTWKPPVTRAPKVDLLLEDVVLQRIETGFVEGPVADLIVAEEQVPDLIYGERFGSFNATVHSR